jgi:hypothetical protein
MAERACGKPVDELCTKHILMHRKLPTAMVFHIATKSDPKDHGGAVFDLRIVNRTDREAFRRKGPAGPPPSGSIPIGSRSFQVERFRRRQEYSSEYDAWTPRPRTWRLPFFARNKPDLRSPRSFQASKRPGAPVRSRLHEPLNRTGPFCQDTNLGPASMHWRGSSNQPESHLSTKFCGLVRRSPYILLTNS